MGQTKRGSMLVTCGERVLLAALRLHDKTAEVQRLRAKRRAIECVFACDKEIGGSPCHRTEKPLERWCSGCAAGASSIDDLIKARRVRRLAVDYFRRATKRAAEAVQLNRVLR